MDPGMARLLDSLPKQFSAVPCTYPDIGLTEKDLERSHAVAEQILARVTWGYGNTPQDAVDTAKIMWSKNCCLCGEFQYGKTFPVFELSDTLHYCACESCIERRRTTPAERAREIERTPSMRAPVRVETTDWNGVIAIALLVLAALLVLGALASNETYSEPTRTPYYGPGTGWD